MPTAVAFKPPLFAKVQSPHVGIRHLAAIVLTVIDAYTEAQRQAADAERRYPFIA
jgi:hypothetical protein